MEAQVCKHFQTGFCKFRSTCRKHHIEEICPNPDCKSKACKKRHPKPCKFYKSHKDCKFGDLCSYSHIISTEHYDNNILLEKVNTMEISFKIMSEKLKILEEQANANNSDQMEMTIKSMSERIKILEEKVNSNFNEEFPCEVCEYKASSTTVLKRHISTKHKQKMHSTPEKVRTSTNNDSLNMSTPIGVRAEDTSLSSSPLAEEIHTPATLQFKCEFCKFECVSSHELQGHISFIHNSSLPHTSKWEQDKCHICNKVFNDTVYFKNHMIELHSFSYKSDKCMHCEESSEVGLYMAMPHQAIFRSCKNCELLVN